MNIFEGPESHVRPAFLSNNITLGMIKLVGKAIAHSLVMDQVGFPYLSPAMYYYLVGQEEKAIGFITDNDLDGKAHYAVTKVCGLFSLCIYVNFCP